MKMLNAYTSTVTLPTRTSGTMIRFESLAMEKETDKRGRLQSIANALCRKGVDATVWQTPETDLIVARVLPEQAAQLLLRYDSLKPVMKPMTEIPASALERMWQNRVRLQILGKSFIRVGIDRYVPISEIRNATTDYKRAYRIQSEVVSNKPLVWVDARTRIMHMVTDQDIAQAEKMGDASEISVMLLPSWIRGILVGKESKKAGEFEFDYEGQKYKTPQYWRVKNHIDFVEDNDEMLKVHVPLFDSTPSYPRSCVFKEYKQRERLPSDLKKNPKLRVSIATDFVSSCLSNINFLGSPVTLQGPTGPLALHFAEHAFPPHSQFQVVVGSNFATPIQDVHSALKRQGPFAGKLDGTCIVIHAGRRDELANALAKIQTSYSELNFGKLQLMSSVGDGGFIDTGGETVADYTSAISQVRAEIAEKKTRALAIVVLPDVYSSEIYYRSREHLFGRIFGAEPLPSQAIALETIQKVLASDRSAYGIQVNTASQCYVKFGGTGTAAWILRDAADCAIPGIQPGSSCYAYHDVSRRPKIKASATAYSAITDSYGRYIATGTRPIGGEKLTPSGFYDVLLDLLTKVSIFSQRFGQVSSERSFQFRRLVFAKDGVIRDDEADMIEHVIREGIPEERKEPIPSLLRRKGNFPKSLILDVIGVNKSPNKRVFEVLQGEYSNVKEGTAICYDDDNGLLISCSSPLGSAQPIEICLKKHLCLNMPESPRPHIRQLLDEYYRLTKLNWASIFRQGKFALPQILTQNLGENISAGVMVQDDMVLL
jgi:hypothetical protein